jgi:enterochelin esterase family protein
MEHDELVNLTIESKILASTYLNREVTIDIYKPALISEPGTLNLLLLNDGQDLPKMPFAYMLENLFAKGIIQPLICVGIHANEERRMEYGTANVLDFMERGAKAAAHTQFVLTELLPFLKKELNSLHFKEMGYAGFSLGGLSAIDIVWAHPELFSIAGVFSGSLWWRSKDLDQGYNEDTDRIMHQQVKNGRYHAGLRFYFTTGSQDETADRNNNGIIDSIDDTLGLIDELKKKGFEDKDIQYINYEDGRHDVETWGRALPAFLEWAWGNNPSKDITTVESC